MSNPTHADAMLFMEYYKLWDTPLDNEAWNTFRSLRAAGAFESFERFRELVPNGDAKFGHLDRVLCAFEQAGVLMRHGLLHPALYFEAWAAPEAVWDRVADVVRGLREEGSRDAYKYAEWLAARAREWRAASHDVGS